MLNQIYSLGHDAELDVLGKYVLSLICADLPDDELRAHCAEQLSDFLNEETENFVTRLFEMLKGYSFFQF